MGLAACGSDSSDEDDASVSIVATTPMMGAIAQDVVGDGAEVAVLIPEGADPHDFQPSAQDIAALNNATLIVANGENLEEGLGEPLEAAAADGVTVFTATEHVELLEGGEDAHSDDEGHSDDEEGHSDDKGEAGHSDDEEGHSDDVEGHSDEEEGHSDEESHSDDEEGHSDDEAGHSHDGDDPHIFTDPGRMATVALALGEALANESVDATGAEETAQRYRAIDGELEASTATVPKAQRALVTGHESMAYWADRYGYEVVATVLPNLSTNAQVSASDIAEVSETIEREGVQAIFAEPDTAPAVAEAISQETGARVVTVYSESFGPDTETYEEYVRQLTDAIVDGLGGEVAQSTG